MHDDGTGEALFVGGDFTVAGGQVASHLARWDGTEWSGLASGMDDRVYALGSHDSGYGELLYAGGSFTTSAALDSRLARWGVEVPKFLPGCFGNTGILTMQPACMPHLGQSLLIQYQSTTLASFFAVTFLFAGMAGTGVGGCGVLVPGVGELLLAPGFQLVASVATNPVGLSSFDVVVPSLPSLVGEEAALQAVNIAVFLAQIELSNALGIRLMP